MNREEELQKLRPQSLGKGGLRNTQAALSLVKKKMAMAHYDSSPEQAVGKELFEDTKATANAVGGVARDIISRRVGMPLNERGRRPAAYNSPPSVSSNTGKAAEMVRRERAKNAVVRETKKAAVKTAKNTAKKTVKKVVRSGAGTMRKGVSIALKMPFVGLPILIAVLLVAIIALITMAISSSPTGIFFSDNEKNPNQVKSIVEQVNNEWYRELAARHREYETQGYTVDVSYGADIGDEGGRVDNWVDCLALYAVISNDSSNAPIGFSDGDIQEIRNLYFKMNPINVTIWTEEPEPAATGAQRSVRALASHTPLPQASMHAELNVTNLRYIQMLDEYNLSEEQKEMLQFLVSSENAPLWRKLGVDYFGMTDADIGNISDIVKNLPKGTLGGDIVEAAFTRIGDPYSMELRGQGNYIDCSGLTQWAYAQVGIELPATAADQAKYCVDNEKVIDEIQLQAGDLIFWSYPNSSRVKKRFMAIGHVAVYVGDGMMIEAAPSAGGVVYREVSVQGTPFMYGRPYV
ncbi:C40 family peptidase [Christensenella hongkongensis]|nr:C40 family peptidase [Christensenella hongkongensis]